MKLFSLLILLLNLSVVFAVEPNNLHLIQKTPNGYAIYRTSEPSAEDMKTFCKLGITEMMVLSGTAEYNEFKYQRYCPNLKVIYNVKQDARIPLQAGFLNSFDQWVQSSQAAGKRIAFRCECGCHRTGRLAAYYEMKYKGLTLEQALYNMNKLGRYMHVFPELPFQVKSMQDYIRQRPCSVDQKYCVRF